MLFDRNDERNPFPTVDRTEEEGRPAPVVQTNAAHKGVGLIAEDVVGAVPELGVYEPDGTLSNYDERGVLALLLLAVQDLSARVEAMEAA